MSNSACFLKLQVKSFMKELLCRDNNGKRKIYKIIFIQIIFSLPIVIMIFLKTNLMKELFTPINIVELLIVFYISYLLFIATQKIIANVFFSEDYDIYLALPIKLKDILISKLIESNLRNILDSLFIFFILVALGKAYDFNIHIFISLVFILIFIEMIFTVYVYLITVLFLSLRNLKLKLLALGSSGIIGFVAIKNFGAIGILRKILFFDVIESKNYIIGTIIYVTISILIVTLIVALTFSLYRKIIDSGSTSTLKIKKVGGIEINRKNIIKSLVVKDLKKIIGNKSLRQGMIIGNVMMFITFITACSIMGDKFISIGASGALIIFMTTLMPIAMVVGTGLPQNLISMDGEDRDLIIAMPIVNKHILQSKIIIALIINLPSIGIIVVMNFIYFFKHPFIFIMTMLLTILSFIAFILMALNEDIKNPKFNWYNTKELTDDYGKTFKILAFSFLIVPIYILSGYLKGNYIFLIVLLLIMGGISIIKYKESVRRLKKIYYGI